MNQVIKDNILEKPHTNTMCLNMQQGIRATFVSASFFLGSQLGMHQWGCMGHRVGVTVV